MLYNITIMDQYDKYIIAFSGGKDSTALLLFLLDIGIPKNKIELWHHDIDGRIENFMDWEVTPHYCKALGRAFDIPVYNSWKEGGFKGELLRENSLTKPIVFEDINYNLIRVGGQRGNKSTRLKFPQVSADLLVRWCSSYLKIDVCTAAIRNQPRFNHIKTVVLSGERGEESYARSKYKIFEPDRADLRNGKNIKRHVDHWRPLRDWKENQIWEIIEKYKIRVHPCYYLGWNRCSCKFCIFGNSNQFCSAKYISPDKFNELVELEKLFQYTIKRKLSLDDYIKTGKPYPGLKDKKLIQLATSLNYTENIFIEKWILPSGAFGENIGPI